MSRIFSARSPLWQISIYTLLFIFAFIVQSVREGVFERSLTSGVAIWVIALLALALAIIYGFSILSYNRKHPQNRIRYWGMLPPEFQEEDEGLAALTARATRRVYIFHASLLPVFSFIYIYFLPAPLWVIAGLAILVLGHFIIYWVSIWPAWSDDEE